MKWLRAHSKHIMVALVLLAMFSFVGAQGLQSWLTPDETGRVVMRAFGREITVGDLQGAQSDTAVLQRLFGSWQLHPDQTVYHWFMLAEEADRAGIQIPEERVAGQIEALEQFRSLDELRRRDGINRSTIRRALNRFIAIQENAARVIGSAVPSEAQLRHYVQDTQAKVGVKFVALNANSFVDKDAPITDAELQAQFDKYKDVFPDEGEFGFGYKFKDRVKLQYVTASVDVIKEAMTVSDEECKEHWRAHREKYKKVVWVDPPAPATQPTTQPTATQPAATQPATTQPAEPPKKIRQEEQKKYSEALEDVRRELKQAKAERIARQAMNKLAEELADPWADARPDPTTGFRPIPGGVDDPAFMKSACDQIAQKFGITLSYAETELSNRDELEGNADLGKATMPGEGVEPLALPELAFRIPAFLKTGRGEEQVVRLQMFQSPGEPLSLAGGWQFVGGRVQQTSARLVVFRVVDARPAESPAGLDEVRTKVEEDIRLLRGYEASAPLADEFAAVAQRLGVEQALTKFDDLRNEKNITRPQTPPPFARRMTTPLTGEALRDAILAGEPLLEPPFVAGAGKSAEFVDACFEMTEDGWTAPAIEAPPTGRVQAAMAAPAPATPPKVRLVSIPSLKKRFIVELSQYTPVAEADYESKHRRDAYRTLSGQRAEVLRTEWFDPKNVERRCGFEDRSGQPAPDSQDTTEAEPIEASL